MAEWQLGERDAARRVFKQAEEHQTNVGPSMSSWSRRETLRLLRLESQALIQEDAQKSG